jgi:serine/threonine protein phosphatase PrpC
MNISFNKLLWKQSETLKTNLSIQLSPLQKKVAAFVVFLFSCIALGYLAYLYYSKNYLNESKLEKQIEEPNPIPAPPKKILTVPERLEKNCRIAKEQQDSQKPTGFVLAKQDIPDTYQSIFIEKPIHAECKEIDHIKVEIASCEGYRDSMEDTHIATQFSFGTQQIRYEALLLGIFDGHGGSEASNYVAKNLSEYLKNYLEANNKDDLTDEGIVRALKECFENLDENFKGDDGTAATVAIVLNNKIWVANLGDSRTMLVKKDGTTIQATEDAKPNIKRYRKKIIKLGGFVLFNRVNGMLALARSIGDHTIGKNNICCVSPTPKITCYSLEEFKGGHIVLACDGLTDVATTNEVGQAIKQMVEQAKPEENMAKRLVFSALENYSLDNVSAMVVHL